jgi:hypothetical protein
VHAYQSREGAPKGMGGEAVWMSRVEGWLVYG